MLGTVLYPGDAAVNKIEETFLPFGVYSSGGKHVWPHLSEPRTHGFIFPRPRSHPLHAAFHIFLAFPPEILALELWETRNDRKTFVMSTLEQTKHFQCFLFP